MSSIDFRFNHLSDKDVYVPLMHKVINISKNSNFTTGDRFATVWSKIFASWTTDEVIESMEEKEWVLRYAGRCDVKEIGNMGPRQAAVYKQETRYW